jgi:anti-anti-sigma regulatory factor
MSHPDRYFQIRTHGPVTVIRFTEPYLNEGTLHRIGEDLARLGGPHGGELHLDFSRVRFLNAGFLSRLLSVHKRVARHGGHLVLKNLAALLDLFRVTRMDAPGDVPSPYAPDVA